MRRASFAARVTIGFVLAAMASFAAGAIADNPPGPALALIGLDLLVGGVLIGVILGPAS